MIDVSFILNIGSLYLLPRLCGLAGEDPHKYLKEFDIVCSINLKECRRTTISSKLFFFIWTRKLRIGCNTIYHQG